MNRRRIAAMLGAFTASVLAVLTGATAAFAYYLPPSGGGGTPAAATPPRTPPGWNKHPPLHAMAHTAVVGGMPGWQIALIAVGSAIAGAVVAVLLDRARAARRHRPATAA
jgi:hypothetical protein